MDFISNSEHQIKEMLQKIGVGSIEELFESIPAALLHRAPQEDDGLSEFEGKQLMEVIANSNEAPKFESYLGAGAYEHHVPAVVHSITQKSEFLTAYTPYQPEASQGMLQAIFEFQSAVCALTGMEVSNASVYDAASACAEAILMALRLRKKAKRVLVHSGLHPHQRAVVEQYLKNMDVAIETVDDLSQVEPTEEVAALLVQSPNFFGKIEDLKEVYARCRASKTVAIQCGNPMAYGIYASPGELGADIAVGDTQPFGVGMQYGGPYVGYIACRQELVRQMPGRIVGETVDSEGRPGFVLTLQPREQHIRREKATSNICSNQALAALASLIAMLWYGKEGVKKLAYTNFQRASYLREKLGELSGIEVADEPIFNEFVVKFDRPIEEVQRIFREQRIDPGVALESFSSARKGELLICVTETKSKAMLDRYLEVAKEVVHAGAYHL